ncbi:hypothetical protein [Mucilaginibacter agri]|uniref:TonB C-terminal domain-containing protein n=1 Tax=Mucilaginibacter agri TaxID=2695265 RepID=A0A965ZBL5_9SPHI|nr:hypothetical protein [Mucilaginibacter agri]NCD68028.1 hypothetical protein [Mucilaginibacter agri]
MKTILTILFIAIATTTHAQQIYSTGTVQGVNHTYIVKTRDFPSNNPLVSIANTQNKTSGQRMKSNRLDYVDPVLLGVKINNTALNNIFKEEIEPSVLQRLAANPQNYVGLIINFKQDGSVLDVTFSTQQTSTITPRIFEKIEDRIKSEITATFNQDKIPGIGAPAYTTFNFITKSYIIYFYKLKQVQ